MAKLTIIFNRFREFKNGFFNAESPNKHQDKFDQAYEFVEFIRDLIRFDPQISQETIAQLLGLDLEVVVTIFKDLLKLGKVNGRWTRVALHKIQRLSRRDWASFILKKFDRGRGANTASIVACFDARVYEHHTEKETSKYFTFERSSKVRESGMIVCFFSKRGFNLVAALDNLRMWSMQELVEYCLNDVINEYRANKSKEKKLYLYLETFDPSSTRLLDFLTDQNVNLIALPESSPDLALTASFLRPDFWPSLLIERFANLNDALAAYIACLNTAEAYMWDELFAAWFKRLQRCLDCDGDYVQPIVPADIEDLSGNDVPPIAVDPRTVMPRFDPIFNGSSDPMISGSTCDRIQPSTSNGQHIDLLTTEKQRSQNWIEFVEQIGHFESELESLLPEAHLVQLQLVDQTSEKNGEITEAEEVIGRSDDETECSDEEEAVNINSVQGHIADQVQDQAQAHTQAHTKEQRRTRHHQKFNHHHQPRQGKRKRRLSRLGKQLKQQYLQLQQQLGQQEGLNQLGRRIYPKPPYSYTCLVALALKNSMTGQLHVSDIYKFICFHFPFYKTAPKGWKNCVRHNLSLNSCFEIIEKSTGTGNQRKGCLWKIRSGKEEIIDKELRKYSRKTKAIKDAMECPENLAYLEGYKFKHLGKRGGTESSSPSEEVEDLMDDDQNGDHDATGSYDESCPDVDEQLNISRQGSSETSPAAKRQKTLTSKVQNNFVHKPVSEVPKESPDTSVLTTTAHGTFVILE